jgi:hypothetical protein
MQGMSRSTSASVQNVGQRYGRERTMSEIFGIPVRTWQQWRLRKTGPTYIKLQRHVLYEIAEVEKWIQEHRTPTGAAQ